MKLSCVPLNFAKEILRDKTMSNEDWITMAAELGLDGTEIYEPFVSSLDASGMARLAGFVQDAGLQVSMYTSESDFSNPEKREQTIAHVKHAVDAALVFRTDIVRLTAASHTLVDRAWIKGVSKEDVMQSVADGLKGCLDYGEEKQVMLALEDHPVIGTNVADLMT